MCEIVALKKNLYKNKSVKKYLFFCKRNKWILKQNKKKKNYIYNKTFKMDKREVRKAKSEGFIKKLPYCGYYKVYFIRLVRRNNLTFLILNKFDITVYILDFF